MLKAVDKSFESPIHGLSDICDIKPNPFKLVSPECIQYVPKQTPQYGFRKPLVEEFVAFLNDAQGDGLMIKGPTGSGKSSLVLELAARLGRPVQQVTCSATMEIQDLIGQFRLVKDSDQVVTKFAYGVLPKAMMFGHILLLDEFDYAPPSSISALNAVIQGSPLIIEAMGGQVVKPHPDFRLVITGNTGGSGDHQGGYVGTRQHNMAFLDRFRIMTVEYMSAVDEVVLLADIFPEKELFIPRMVDLAVAVRESNLKGDLATTMSLRVMKRWLRLMDLYTNDPCPLKRALNAALLSRLDPNDSVAINEMALGIFGSSWEK